MSGITLSDLQASVKDKKAFSTLNDYFVLCDAFLAIIEQMKPTRIVSPKDHAYIFFQYNEEFKFKITRPLNQTLFYQSQENFRQAYKRFLGFLDDLRKYNGDVVSRPGVEEYLSTNEINRVVYTLQQSIGCIGDSFDNPNQSRKRVGQLFENLIKLIIKEIGFACESRTINIPIPGYEGYRMSYELDLVFSRNQVIIASETNLIHPSEVVGSVKTTSKDRIDKIFLDKYMLTRLLGREIPVVAIFLHDVQRAKTKTPHGQSIFGINSTFKTNHFLGYTVALNKLDGVYYVDPRPVMSTDARLRAEIQDFQTFLVQDIWIISARD